MPMQLSIEVDLNYSVASAGAAILTLEAARTGGQEIRREALDLTPSEGIRVVPGDEGIGLRRLIPIEERLECRYRAEIAITRAQPAMAAMKTVEIPDLSAEVLRYLLPSRYCDSDRLVHFVATRFEGLTGGALVASARDWIEENLAYVPGVSTARTTAIDTFLERRGVCRDYAHLLVAMCRAGQVPARIASVYGVGVDPQDFHAVAQVHLDGAWHLVDPTGMSAADAMAVIAVGRDATDVAFLTTIADARLEDQRVQVRRLA
ncbi:MAG: transglutaminase family protein [Paracoccus sp. (in: a-proteobacteria)]|nr:transglutaminase family protein [Paracoccus sp. (in: a-proteobacteria)]